MQPSGERNNSCRKATSLKVQQFFSESNKSRRRIKFRKIKEGWKSTAFPICSRQICCVVACCALVKNYCVFEKLLRLQQINCVRRTCCVSGIIVALWKKLLRFRLVALRQELLSFPLGCISRKMLSCCLFKKCTIVGCVS